MVVLVQGRQAWGERVWPAGLTSKVPVSFQDHLTLFCSPRAGAPALTLLTRGGGVLTPRELGGEGRG